MKANDLMGMKFGTLTVVGFDEERHNIDLEKRKNGEIDKIRRYWLCHCSKCNKIYSIRGENLMSGNTKGCICDQHERTGITITQHGFSHTHLENIYQGMKYRCYDSKCYEYNFYGGRGIRICDEWLNDRSKFYEWAINNGYVEGLSQSEQSIDRINVDGNYCPNNCRFVDIFVQANNKTNNIEYEYNGEIHTLAEWGRIVSIGYHTLYNRVNKLKWTIEEALILKPSHVSQRNN